MIFKLMVNFKAGDTWHTIFIITCTAGSKEKYNPPVSLLKQFFLKIIVLHHMQRYQSNPIRSGVRSGVRSGIRSGFAVGKRFNLKIPASQNRTNVKANIEALCSGLCHGNFPSYTQYFEIRARKASA